MAEIQAILIAVAFTNTIKYKNDQEAARYYHIGEGKLRTLIDAHPNEDFYVMNGNRALIKREKFERYLDQATAV